MIARQQRIQAFDAQHVRDLAWLRRVRDRIDREYAPPCVAKQVTRPIGNREGRVTGLLSRHSRLRGPQRRRIQRDAVDHGRPPDQPDTSIVLPPPAADPGIPDDERRTIVGMMAKGTYAVIALAAADLDGTFERVQVSGAEVVQEPTEQPYGVRDCAVRDPAGHVIGIQELR